VTGVLAKVAAEHELSLTQLRLLAILRDRTPTLSDLAERLDLDRSSVTGLIDRAAARDLVRRVPSDSDRRSYRVELTEDGLQVARVMSRQTSRHITAVTANMTPADRTALDRLLRTTAITVG
jgi:DNA-binding MarR family transcriptional regulator